MLINFTKMNSHELDHAIYDTQILEKYAYIYIFFF